MGADLAVSDMSARNISSAPPITSSAGQWPRGYALAVALMLGGGPSGSAWVIYVGFLPGYSRRERKIAFSAAPLLAQCAQSVGVAAFLQNFCSSVS